MTTAQWRRRIEELVEKIRAETPAFADDSEEAKAARRAKAAKDFFFFAETYLPHYYTYPSAPMHRITIKALGTPGLKAFSLPRDFGKTLNMTQAYPLWKALNKTIHFAVIIGKSKDDAVDLLLPVKLECEANERLRQDYGELRGSRWEFNDFTLKTGIRFLGLGRGQQIRGRRWRQYRPDYIVADDIEDEVLARNPKRVKELLQWFLSTVVPAADKNGTIVWVGTLLAKKSALAQLLDPQADLTGEGVPIDATRMQFSATRKDGKAAWPERWPLYALEARRLQMGTPAYMKEFEGKISDAGSLFQREWFRDYTSLPRGLIIVIINDPAVGRRPENCYQATIALGLDREKMDYYVLHARLRREPIRTMLERQFDLYIEYNRNYMVLYVGFEANGFQVVLHDVWETLIQERKIRPPVKEIYNRVSKEIRVEGLVPLAEGGHIYVRRGHSDQNLLLDQLEFWGQMEKDGPDVLEMAVSLLKGVQTRFDYESVGRRSMAFAHEDDEGYGYRRHVW